MNCNVLIAEDNPDLMNIWSRAFERAGFRVAGATTGQEAMRCLDADLPQVLITDYHMPEGNGYELVNYLRGLPTGDQVTVIMISADRNTPKGPYAERVDLFLQKPVHYADMVTLAKRLVGQDQPMH